MLSRIHCTKKNTQSCNIEKKKIQKFLDIHTCIIGIPGTLNFLFTSFRMIQQSFIDMENMFELLDESHEVIYCISDLMIWKTG